MAKGKCPPGKMLKGGKCVAKPKWIKGKEKVPKGGPKYDYEHRELTGDAASGIKMKESIKKLKKLRKKK